MGSLPERALSGDDVLLGGRYRLHVASGDDCTGACATVGLDHHGALLVSIGDDDQPVDDASVCAMLMNWDSRALRVVSLQPAPTGATPNFALPGTPTATRQTTAADTLMFVRGTVTNASGLETRRANAAAIVEECEEYDDNPARNGTIVLGFLGYVF